MLPAAIDELAQLVDVMQIAVVVGDRVVAGIERRRAVETLEQVQLVNVGGEGLVVRGRQRIYPTREAMWPAAARRVGGLDLERLRLTRRRPAGQMGLRESLVSAAHAHRPLACLCTSSIGRIKWWPRK